MINLVLNSDSDIRSHIEAVCDLLQGRAILHFLSCFRKNPIYPTKVNILDRYSLRNSNFNSKYPTVIYIHGYSGGANVGSAVAIREGTFTIFDLTFLYTRQ